MKTLPFKFLLTFSAVAIVTFSSCTKDDEEMNSDQKETYSQTTRDETESEAMFDDVDNVSYAAIAAQESSSGRIESDTLLCSATITLSSATVGKLLTVDFGTGCTDAKGKIRKGIVKVHFTKVGYLTPGNVITTTFENYSVNGVKVEGTRIVKNTTTTGAIKFDVAIEAGKLTWPDQTTSELTMAYTKKWVNPFVSDELHYFGTAAGKDRAGVTYTGVVNEATPIIYKRACFASNVFIPVSGKKIITSSEYPGKAATIDFGDGTCDKKVTLSVEGKLAEIAL